MSEAPKFAGLWICPDYEKPLNDAPPYRYECEGFVLTDEGAKAFEDELDRLYAEGTHPPGITAIRHVAAGSDAWGIASTLL